MKSFVLAALLAVSCTSHAQYMSGNRLLEHIESDSVPRNTFASGYVTGIADSLDGTVFCIPQGVTVGQIRDIVELELVSRPSERHLPSAIFVVDTMARLWPCQANQGRKGSSS